MRNYYTGEAFMYDDYHVDFELAQSDSDCNLSLKELGETELTYRDDGPSSEDEEHGIQNLMNLKEVVMPLSPSMKTKNTGIITNKWNLNASRKLRFDKNDD